jgi:peptidoglycan/LPS O-acetylase OafA/YrhL
MNYIKSLDGLRAIAILLVLLFHFFYTVEVGWVGVQLFFVLSGYLITTILLNSKTQAFGPYIKRFYWRRVLRIFPLYYFYIILVAGIYLIQGIPENFPKLLPYLLTYAYNFVSIFEGFEIDLFFTHFWSLAIEEQFYLFWPFVIFFLNRRTLKIVLIVILLLAPVIRCYFADYLINTTDYTPFEIGEIVYRFTPGQFDSFAFGALIPLFNLQERIQRKARFFSVVSLGCLALCSWHYFALKSAGHELNFTSLGLPIGGIENGQHVWSYSLIGLFSVALILLVTETKLSASLEKIKKVLLENRLMVETGKISYGIYVYHWILLAVYRKLIHPLVQNHFLSFLLYFAIVYAASYFSFVLFEKRFLKLKDKRFKL